MIGVEPIMSLSVFAAGSEIEVDNVDEDIFDFDEGGDLECDISAALSSDGRKAADKNCLEFDEHVAQVGSPGLIVGPFRTPIEPCTSSNINFDCSFG